MLACAAAMLSAVRRTHLSRPVTYRRGTARISVPAAVGRSDYETADAAGAVTLWRCRDYLIAAADLVLGGDALEPEAGDEIEDGDSRYQVSAPPGHPPAELDAFGLTWRIHAVDA